MLIAAALFIMAFVIGMELSLNILRWIVGAPVDISSVIDKAALGLLCYAAASIIVRLQDNEDLLHKHSAALKHLLKSAPRSRRVDLAPDAPQWDDIIAPRQDVRPGASATRQKVAPGYEPLRKSDRIFIARKNRR